MAGHEECSRSNVRRQLVARLGQVALAGAGQDPQRPARAGARRTCGEVALGPSLGTGMGRDDAKQVLVQAYARALGLAVGVDLHRTDMTLVDRIKRDTLTTRDTLQHIAALSCGDSTMVDGLRGFMYELLANTSWSVAQVEQRFATYARGIPTEKAPTVSYRGDALPVRKAIAPRKL